MAYEDEAQYFAARAQQERDRAKASPLMTARMIHLEMAQLYDERGAASFNVPEMQLAS